MKTKMTIIKLILIVLIIFILFIIWYFRPQYVKMELITSISNSNININNEKSNFNSEFHWWFIDTKKNISLTASEQTMSPDMSKELVDSYPENLLNWGIDFNKLNIDSESNNVILAFSREIKEMKFKRADKFPYNTISTVKTVMSKEFNVNTIYIYKIPKYNVREDLRAYTETYIEN